MIVPLGGFKDAVSVARALIRAFKHLPAHLRKTRRIETIWRRLPFFAPVVRARPEPVQRQ
jgi:hypothetical protein